MKNTQKNDPIFPETEIKEDHKPKHLKERLFDIYYEALPLFNLNIFWFLLSLGLVTFLPALGGLYHAIQQYHRKQPANWQVFWDGFKENWLVSLKWGVIVLLGDLILAANIWFSLNIDAAWRIYTLSVGVIIAIMWIAINQFSFPLLLLQKEKKIFLAIRNGYVIVVRQPWDALKTALLCLLITFLAILIPPLWFFIAMALIAHLQTRAVLRAVEKIRSQDTPDSPRETGNQRKKNNLGGEIETAALDQPL